MHKPEQSALNRLKQDDRSKKQLSDTIESLRETAKRFETGDKELKRIGVAELKEDPAKVLESMKDRLSDEDTAKLKALLEKSQEALNSEEAKKVIEEAKKKALAAAKPKSAATTKPPEKFGPSTFDKVPPPTPPTAQPAMAKIRTPAFFVDGDDITFPPNRDPQNPQRVLPPSDPRSRTYVVTGNAQVKTPSMVLEGDRIEMVASANGGGITAPSPAAKPAKGKPNDPVQPGIGSAEAEKKDAPFDRVTALGRVKILRILGGKTQTGKGGSMIYDKKSGTMILTDWPQAQVDGNVITGVTKDAKIILVPEGQPRTENCRVEQYDQAAAPTSPAEPKSAPTPPAKAKLAP